MAINFKLKLFCRKRGSVCFMLVIFATGSAGAGSAAGGLFNFRLMYHKSRFPPPKVYNMGGYIKLDPPPLAKCEWDEKNFDQKVTQKLDPQIPWWVCGHQPPLSWVLGNKISADSSIGQRLSSPFVAPLLTLPVHYQALPSFS